MTPTEPPESTSSNKISFLWVWGLVGIVAILCITSFLSMRTGSGKTINNATRLYVDIALESKQFYFLNQNASDSKSNHVSANRLISKLREAIEVTHSQNSYRRLAIFQNYIHDDGWKATLLGLRTAQSISGAKLDTQKTEREIAMWNRVFSGKPSREETSKFASKITEYSLGWHERLALKILYQNAGMTKDADLQSDVLNDASIRVLLVTGIGVLAGLGGLCVGIGFVL